MSYKFLLRSHWILAIICFPGLVASKSEKSKDDVKTGNKKASEAANQNIDEQAIKKDIIKKYVFSSL